MPSRKSTMVQIATLMALVAALAGSAWASGNEKILYGFNGYDGSGPDQNLTFDAQRNLWGTTTAGGETNLGALFKLTPGPNGTWTETVQSFQDDHKGGIDPKSGVIFDKAGNLYGATGSGGPYGAGTIFEIRPGPNGMWSETVLYSYGNNDPNGGTPWGDLLMDKAGNIYGTVSLGGRGIPGKGISGGTVIEMSQAANGAWTETILYSFPMFGAKGGKEGTAPKGGLIFEAAGNLYGTAAQDGPTNHFSVVFEILAGTGPAVSTEVQSPPVIAPSPAPTNPANPAPSSPVTSQGIDPLAAVWQSDAFGGQTFRFRLNANAIEVYGSQQEPLGKLEAKEKKGAIDMYQGLVQIGPLTQCPGGHGLMQIKAWNESRLDARIETPVNGAADTTCGGVMGMGRLIPWQRVTFVKR